MEKTTKKSKKKSRRLKKRIGIIAIGGLSFVLTICLSVGATLAWFAGSSWASNDLYMGGPVYVEMAGKGEAGGTAGSGSGSSQKANWVGGAGNLDIKAASTRTTGSIIGGNTATAIPDNILLPGQKVQIFSQARVFSTKETNSVADGAYDNNSSGANTTNTSKPKDGVAQYVDGSGRITSTTTSVLRARFSISVEFDPSVGFNNFTDKDYMEGYPKQSTDYTGDAADGTSDMTWEGAMSAADANTTVWTQSTTAGVTTVTGRRDGVANKDAVKWTNGTDETALTAVKNGTAKSIFKWRYCSATEHEKATDAKSGVLAMGKPFDGTVANNGIVYYGVWICDKTTGDKLESDAFFKARTNAYLQSYVEFYENEYGNTVTRTIQNSITSLDTALNNDFKKLINDSSDDIQNGKVYGFTVENGVKTAISGTLTGEGEGKGVNASWLYIDPSIGNDTNTNEISTSTGGWWYLVESDGLISAEGGDANTITLTADEHDGADKAALKADANTPGVNTLKDKVTVGSAEVSTATRGTTGFGATDEARKYAKLYEIDPTIDLDEKVGRNYKADGSFHDVVKVVSVSFPFVNGTFALPGDALTNVFANAKISFQISFQALQAFFPYTSSIDGIDYQDTLFGVAKALNIKNAIPVFNEAFDYQETFSGDSSAIPL